MVRSVVLSLGLLVAHGLVYADASYTQASMEEKANEEAAGDFRLTDEERNSIQEWHESLNPTNAEGTMHFTMLEQNFVGFLDMQNLDLSTLQVRDTGRGFMIISVRPLGADSDEQEIEYVMQNFGVTPEKISVEFAATEKVLVISVPTHFGMQVLPVVTVESLGDITLFRGIKEAFQYDLNF